MHWNNKPPMVKYIQYIGRGFMKRILILLLTITMLLLVACGNGSNELSKFVESFNQSARKYDTVELTKDEFGEVVSENGEDWRNLYESKEYSIDEYTEDDLIGYYITVRSDSKSISKEGKGYNAVLTMADALDVDINELEKGMQAAFNEDFYSYEDGDYNVRISVINITNATINIMFEKNK